MLFEVDLGLRDVWSEMANHAEGFILDAKFMVEDQMTDDLRSVEVDFVRGEFQPELLTLERIGNVRHEELYDQIVVEADVMIPR